MESNLVSESELSIEKISSIKKLTEETFKDKINSKVEKKLTQSVDEFAGFQEKFVVITVVDEEGKPKNLIKRTTRDTVKFEVSDFFMNRVLAGKALKNSKKRFCFIFWY